MTDSQDNCRTIRTPISNAGGDAIPTPRLAKGVDRMSNRATTPPLDNSRASISRPPLRARLSRYVLTKSERALLIAMCEQCSDGSCIWASIDTMVLYSDLSESHIRNLIHGRRDRKGSPGLLERGILSELAPAKGWPRPCPATYRINEDALHVKPKVASRLEARSQMTLPGIRRPSVPGEPVKVASDDAGEQEVTVRQNQASQMAPGADDRWHQVPTIQKLLTQDLETHELVIQTRGKRRIQKTSPGIPLPIFRGKKKTLLPGDSRRRSISSPQLPT